MADSQKPRQLVHFDEVPLEEESYGQRFASKSRRLGSAAGGEKIACTWYEVPPGKAAGPRHFHCIQEEALFILEGRGTLQLGEEGLDYPLFNGSYVALPPGPDSTRILINTGTTPLRYLAIASNEPADIVVHPDSGKIGPLAVDPDSGEFWVRHMFRQSDGVDYYEGE